MSELSNIWPKKISVSAYRKAAFAAGALSVNTIKNNIRKGLTPGEQEGSIYFVWVNQHLQPEWPSNHKRRSEQASNNLNQKELKPNTGNKLADSIMENYLLKN